MIALDRHGQRWVVTHRTGWLDPVFIWLSHIGAYGAVWLGLALLAAVLWRRPQIFLLVAAADLVAELSSLGLKYAVGRPRPPHRYPSPEPLVHVPGTPSFPSGHAATSFACATLLAFAAPKLAVPILALASAIAFSRVYAGVHYPLDALGGAALGVAVATALRLRAGGPRRPLRALRGS